MDVDGRPRRQPVGVAGRPRSGRPRASSSAATSTRYPTAVRSTARSECVVCAAPPSSACDVRPGRSAIVNFADEEGARFGVACAGSRLLTGALTPSGPARCVDADGADLVPKRPPRPGPRSPVATTKPLRSHRRVRRAARRAGTRARRPRRTDRAGQRDLAARAVAHRPARRGQSRRARRASPTAHDPMLALRAGRARGARKQRNATARWPPAARCMVDTQRGERDRVARARPGSTPGRPSRRRAGRVASRRRDAAELGADDARSPGPARRPSTQPLRARLADALGDAPVLATGAGHDAGILAAAGIPSAMIFVRNPTGVSHSPAEFAERDDCLAGVGRAQPP